MKKSIKKQIDQEIDDYIQRNINILTGNAGLAFIAGEIKASNLMGVKYDRPSPASLEYARDYKQQLIDEGSSTINGKKIKWMADRKKELRQQVFDKLEEGFKEGRKTYGKGSIADDIAEILGTEHWKAQRIARTEVKRIMNIGTINRYNKNSVKYVQVLDNEGDNSCEKCAELNQQIWTVEYAQSHELEHPNCVRTFIPIFDEELPEGFIPDDLVEDEEFSSVPNDPLVNEFIEMNSLEELDEYTKRMGIEVINDLSSDERDLEECNKINQTLKDYYSKFGDLPKIIRYYDDPKDSAFASYNIGYDRLSVNISHYQNTPLREDCYEMGWFSTDLEMHCILHELAHMQSEKNVPMDELIDRFYTTVKEGGKWKLDPIQLTGEEREIALKVSDYAAADRLEFIAEMMVGVEAGKEYPPEVWDLLDKYYPEADRNLNDSLFTEYERYNQVDEKLNKIIDDIFKIEEKEIRSYKWKINSESRKDISEEDNKTLKQYSYFSADINDTLRSGEVADDGIYKKIKIIKDIIKKETSTMQEDTVLWRGVNREIIQAMKRASDDAYGNTLFDAGFMSTSLDPDVAFIFGTDPYSKKVIMLKIICPSGTKGAYIGNSYGFKQDETLLPNGSVLHIVDDGYYRPPTSQEIKVLKEQYGFTKKDAEEFMVKVYTVEYKGTVDDYYEE